MALSDQIKVPAQVKGAVGGGGGSLSAAEIPGVVCQAEASYQTITTNTQTEIAFGSSLIEIGGEVRDGVNAGRFYAPIDGVYEFTADLNYLPFSPGLYVNTYFGVNGAMDAGRDFYSTANAYINHQWSTLLEMTTGDYASVEVFCEFQDLVIAAHGISSAILKRVSELP